MKHKKIICLLTSLAALTACALPQNAPMQMQPVIVAGAADIVESGAYGSTYTYTLDADGTLTLTGSGEPSGTVPWKNNPEQIKQVILPDGITKISGHMFEGCINLTSITIPDGVTSIAYYAFKGCTALTKIDIPDSVTSIEYYAFKGCTALAEINIPASVTKISYDAFDDTAWLEAKQQENPLVIINSILLTGKTCSGDVVIPEGVTFVSSFAFSRNKEITSVTFPESVETLDSYCFNHCSQLTNVVNVESISKFGSDDFFDTPWLDAQTDKTPLYIVNGYVLDGKKCTGEVTIPEGTTHICGDAFEDNNAITSVTVPASVEKIGIVAFSECEKLQSVTILNPECDLFPDSRTFCNSKLSYSAGSFSGTIYGLEGSTAETYAQNYGYNFALIGTTPPPAANVHDFNGDGTVSVADAVVLLKYVSETADQIAAGTEPDFDGDSMITVLDAAAFLETLSETPV